MTRQHNTLSDKLIRATSGIGKTASEIRSLIESARSHVAVSANLTLVNLYWNVGRIITQDVQKNEKRAEYGAQLLAGLAGILTREYGEGYSKINLQDMRRFHEYYEINQTPSDLLVARIDRTVSAELPGDAKRQTASAELQVEPILQTLSAKSSERIIIDFRKHFRLGWSHYRLLLSQSDPVRRRFYFEQASSQRWPVRELKRQIDRGLFERVALSKNTRQLVEQEKRKVPTDVARHEDVFKDPYVLDFLGLKGSYSEKDLESAIIRNLEQFLSELGTDFCFIGRQYAMRIDDDDYFLDLLFYHRGLSCLVAIDLKIGTFTAADKGQMDLYLAWLKEHEWRKGENEPVGLILCTSKRRQHVELLLRHGPHKMKVAEYLTQLPDKSVLETRLKMYGKLLQESEL
ncbi:MAG: PDDEXK nuclease domain-containing protein [Kiritimatiellia bacterium]|jgi:predicted nuclease of restriction endonuclease-like (RecB) superfamily